MASMWNKSHLVFLVLFIISQLFSGKSWRKIVFHNWGAAIKLILTWAWNSNETELSTLVHGGGNTYDKWYSSSQQNFCSSWHNLAKEIGCHLFSLQITYNYFNAIKAKTKLDDRAGAN